MSGLKLKTNLEGLSQENNRVALPTVSDFTETYTSLPEDMWLGFSAELEGYRAVLCKNAGTARAANVIVQRAGTRFVADETTDDNAAIFDREKGDSIIYITEASIAANAWEGDYIFFAGHPFPYIVVENDASATIESVNNVVQVRLNRPLVRDVGDGTDMSRATGLFDNITLGSTGKNKALGITMAPVAADAYFWAVYRGLLFRTGGGDAGDYFIKAASGAIQKYTVAAGDWDEEILGRSEGAHMVFLDIHHVAY